MKTPTQVAQERQAVVAEAHTWLRTPYHPHARVKGAGVDCVQILIAVYSAVGVIAEFDTGHYAPDWMLHHSEELYLNGMEKYAHRVDAPLPGDVVMYKFGRCVSHGGIVVEWPLIIHAHMNDRQVNLCEGDKGVLSGRLYGFYSMWGS